MRVQYVSVSVICVHVYVCLTLVCMYVYVCGVYVCGVGVCGVGVCVWYIMWVVVVVVVVMCVWVWGCSLEGACLYVWLPLLSVFFRHPCRVVQWTLRVMLMLTNQ